MRLEEEYALSFYEEIVRIREDKDIWLVRHVENGQFYVKKYVSLYDKEVYERVRHLSLRAIPRIYCCVEEAGRLIVVEDYIHGRSLAQIVQEDGVFSAEEAVEIVLSLCDTLGQLHRMTPPLIHRDLKPSNVLLTGDGAVKLVDFNAARLYRKDVTQDTRLMGTPEYAAPEQYGFGQSDVRTDIYGLGVTLNFLLTGDTPGRKPAPEPFRSLVERCLQMDPDGRYQSVEEFAGALHGLADGASFRSRVFSWLREWLSAPPEKPKVKGWRRFLPVGFRTGKFWHMLTAVFGYLMILELVLAEPFQENGVPLTGTLLAMNQGTMLLILLGAVCWCGNYLGIQQQFPGMKRVRIVRLLLGALYLILYACGMVFLLVMSEGLVRS